MLIWCWYDVAISIAFQWQQNDTLLTSLYQCWYGGDTSTLKRYRHRVTDSDGFVNTKTILKNDVETMHKLWLIFYRGCMQVITHNLTCTLITLQYLGPAQYYILTIMNAMQINAALHTSILLVLCNDAFVDAANFSDEVLKIV